LKYNRSLFNIFMHKRGGLPREKKKENKEEEGSQRLLVNQTTPAKLCSPRKC